MTIQVKVRKFASSSVGYMGGDNVSLESKNNKSGQNGGDHET
jgi:hypothetical protein